MFKTIPILEGLTEKLIDNLKERLFKYSEREPNTGCWIWTGELNQQKYGRIGIRWQGKHRNVLAHRASYELEKGTIPPGLELDHVCRQPLCINPDHLKPCHRRENFLNSRAPARMNLMKTHCPKGHAYENNLYIFPDGRRECKTCKKRRSIEWAIKQRSKP
jgi:hypothetical protein